ncbi:MAG: TIGR04255 family protein [Planctomycetota bacterium]|jgi:uncharacterized protein (TIGR04255 family)
MKNPRFQIDLDKTFQTLKNAPIVEAVIQFNAPPSIPFSQPDLKETLAKSFTTCTILDLMQYEARIQDSFNGDVAMHHRAHWDGFRLHSEDGKHICQWKRSSLIFSRLQPYVNWSEFLDAASPFWAKYREIGEPPIIEGLGVRFISQIPLKENEKPSMYVKQVPPPLKGLGLRSASFFHQDTIPLRGYPYEVRLIRAMQPAAEATGSKRVLIVDIDVSTTVAVAFDQLERSLAEMRYIKNKLFFTYMKDAEDRFR